MTTVRGDRRAIANGHAKFGGRSSPIPSYVGVAETKTGISQTHWLSVPTTVVANCNSTGVRLNDR